MPLLLLLLLLPGGLSRPEALQPQVMHPQLVVASQGAKAPNSMAAAGDGSPTANVVGGAVAGTASTEQAATATPGSPDARPPIKRYTIAAVEFERVETPFLIGLWIFCASLAKIGKFLHCGLRFYCGASPAAASISPPPTAPLRKGDLTPEEGGRPCYCKNKVK